MGITINGAGYAGFFSTGEELLRALEARPAIPAEELEYEAMIAAAMTAAGPDYEEGDYANTGGDKTAAQP